MPNILVTGAQWGDEGKGKVVDHLAARARYSVRFGGGANAGHTLVVNGKKLVLHLVPSGILHAECIGLVGNGCVVEPAGLLAEIAGLQAAQVDVGPARLRVSNLAHVVTPYHRVVDGISGKTIGTTGRGIGPAYTDKVRRTGVRLGDVLTHSHLPQLEAQYAIYTKLYPEAELAPPAQVAENLREQVAQLQAYVADVGVEVDAAIRRDDAILFEGAQGALLDVDHGTYPFVTSSTTTAGGVSSGVGTYVELGRRVAVLKAYSTRVGNGPFGTELFDDVGRRIREIGREVGATTGRPRRCGWLDLPALRHAFRLNGINDMAITKLDVLAGLPTLQVATEYRAGAPVYRTFEGFDAVTDISSYEALPASARNYLEFIGTELGVRLSILSLGAERMQTLILHDLFAQ
jgi:adenylosuccinate synthase